MTLATSEGQKIAGDMPRFSAAAAQRAATWLRSGRHADSFARQACTSSRISTGTMPRSGDVYTMRYITDADEAPGPPLNGAAPLAAKASTEPRENTSLGAPAAAPSTCSGDMNEGVPMIDPVAVSRESARVLAMPKSITRGPSEASSTLAGLRSRCTSPAAWIARSASASPAASRQSAGTGSGPYWETRLSSDGPETNAVASHGGRSSTPAATTGAV